MVNTTEYNSLPSNLKKWVDSAASMIESPARRDEVRKSLSAKILGYYEQHSYSEKLTLDYFGDASIEAEKNKNINQLPDRFEWKVWRNFAVILSVFAAACAVGVLMTFSSARAAFHEVDPAMVSRIGIGRYSGGATPGGMLVMLVVFLLLAIILYLKAGRKKKETETLYSAFNMKNPFSDFGK